MLYIGYRLRGRSLWQREAIVMDAKGHYVYKYAYLRIR